MAEPAVSPYLLPFAEANDYFRQKLRLPTQGWTDIWQQQHSHAFVVAGAAKDDLVSDFYNAIAQARDSGMGLPAFRQSFDAIVAKHGWTHQGSAGWRSRIIYQTNIQQAFNAGRYKQMQAVKDTRPYWQYYHTPQEHPRLQHLAWNGLILSADDPWWDTHTPQNGWNCKCRVFSLSRFEAEREWRQNGKDGPDTAPPIEWEEQVVGKNSAFPRTVMTPKGIDPGFAYNPGKAWLEPFTVPPLPEHLAQLAPERWPFPPGFKMPPSPQPTEVTLAKVTTPEGMSARQAVDDFLRRRGALNAPVLVTDKSGAPLVIGRQMFYTLDGRFKPEIEGKQGRIKYLPMLDMTLDDPDEIWISWETRRTGNEAGRKMLVRHLLRSFVFTDETGKVRYGVAVFRKGEDFWDGVTIFHSDRSDYFEAMRRGYLAYKK